MHDVAYPVETGHSSAFKFTQHLVRHADVEVIMSNEVNLSHNKA